MIKRISKQIFTSLGSKLGLFFALVTFLLAALLIFQNIYAVRIIHEKVAKSFEGNLTQFMNRTDNNLKGIDKYLVSKFVDSLPLTIFNQGKEDSQYNLSLVDLNIEFTREISWLESAGGIYAYSTITQDLILGLSPTATFSLKAKDELKSFLTIAADLPNKNWVFQRFGDQDFLLRVLRIGSYFFGAWIDVSTIVENFQSSALSPEMEIFFLSEGGNLFPHISKIEEEHIEISKLSNSYYISGSPTRYLVIGSSSSKGEFYLAGIIPDKEVLQQLSSFRLTNTVIAVFVIILVFIFFILIRQVVLNPLNKIVDAMVTLRNGNLESRVDSSIRTKEFALASETFNHMASEIKNLRINVYEEQIHAQKAELLSLRLQINPHFLLNSLNILFQMAQLQKFQLIQELSLCLSKYFRFMFKSRSDLVPLKEEWDHLKNYLRIQELRFPRLLKTDLKIEENLPDINIPPLLLHTFIENSIKHGMQQNNPLKLRVIIQMDYENGLLKIRIQDNGPGFSSEVLEKFNKGITLTKGSGDRIGIDNIRKRLSILYGEKVEFKLLNNVEKCCATIDISLPYNLRGST